MVTEIDWVRFFLKPYILVRDISKKSLNANILVAVDDFASVGQKLSAEWLQLLAGRQHSGLQKPLNVVPYHTLGPS